MKIAAINGSPKAKDSLSALLIDQLAGMSGQPIATYPAIQWTQKETPKETLTEILGADVLLIVFPLYIDSLPAPLIALLTRLASAAQTDDTSAKRHAPRVYAVVNCGFYEAEQTQPALTMARHFAERAGLPWGYGVGIGCGPMLSSMGSDWSKGLAAKVHAALLELANAARQGAGGPDVFAHPSFPRVLYKAAAHLGWRRLAGQNGVRKKLRARPYA